MRFSQLFIILSLMLFFSCKKDLKKELDDLKLERKNIDEKITRLQKEFEKNHPVKKKEIPVYVEPVTFTTFSKYVQLQGKVDARNSVIANARTPGVVTRITVHNGQYVGRGQVLAYLDDNVLAQSIREIDLQIQLAKDIYNRQSNLWKQNIGTEVQLISARNNYEAAMKRKNTVLSQKELYLVKSPISGVVDDVMVKVGQMMSPGSPFGIRIVNESNLKVISEVGESYISTVNSGDEVSVVFPDIRDSIKTKISYVSKTIDEIKRAFDVEISLPQNMRLKPNMLAEIKVASYTNSKAIVVSFGIIQNDAQGDYIMVLREGRVTKARIRKGESYNGKTEILDGLLMEDKIITVGFEGLQEGDNVKIISNI